MTENWLSSFGLSGTQQFYCQTQMSCSKRISQTVFGECLWQKIWPTTLDEAEEKNIFLFAVTLSQVYDFKLFMTKHSPQRHRFVTAK